MGWDAFGLPAENAAIQNNVPPAKWTARISTTCASSCAGWALPTTGTGNWPPATPTTTAGSSGSSPACSRKGLAYKKKAEVNWCETDQTVLANEQVVDGCCWRCDKPVERREIDQWFIKITDYAEQLLNDLDKLDQWPEQVRTMQRNWIGRSEGVDLDFTLADGTPTECLHHPPRHPDGSATYLAVAPQHPLARSAAAEQPRTGRVSSRSPEQHQGGRGRHGHHGKARHGIPASGPFTRSAARRCRSGWPTLY